VSIETTVAGNLSSIDLNARKLPRIIQGGMGIAVSSSRMAKIVSTSGQLGVVSGTAIDSVLVRRLQDGDIANEDNGHAEGELRRAMAHFPDQKIVQQILDRYFIEGGKDKDAPYLDAPKLSLTPHDFSTSLIVVANFVEVFLAKEGHLGEVGINLLEKIQLATPASIFGAMLAGVDYILMGAGIPADIPALISQLVVGEAIKFPIRVDESTSPHFLNFNPHVIKNVDYSRIKRPVFLAIVSSHILANYLGRDPLTRPDGFVIEGPSAGGHNAPPRAKESIGEDGQVVFSEKDLADIEKVKALGFAFWLAGGYSSPQLLHEAISTGAAGVQVGTLFALAHESGFTSTLRAALLEELRDHTLTVRTEPKTSATGFPFKVVELAGSMTEKEEYSKRTRVCDLGYLRSAFERADGGVGYRCTAEPVKTFTFKGGKFEDTENVKCLCNALMSNIGLAQHRVDNYVEPTLVTLGSDLHGANQLIEKFPQGWSAVQAIDYLLAK
jgi:NAD(P)H-dependent flavin oxidoreductase YrpB (nitropropane dioxygenase family)